MRMVNRWCVAVIMVMVCSLGGLARGADGNARVVVARVDVGSVTLDQILEQWAPAWYEITSQAITGAVAPGEVDARIQEAWDKAVDAAVRDEVFYQESVREFENFFQKLVEGYASGAGGSGTSRRQIEERLRGIINRNRQQQIDQIIRQSISSAGGFDNLVGVLRARGLTYEEWKERIVRKAYTYGYLFTLFEPMGDKVQPSPAKVLAYYRENQDKFTEPGRIVFRHIFLDNATRGGEDGAYDAATRVYSAIADGRMDFVQAAQTYSEDAQTKATGGLVDDISADPEREAWLSEVRRAASQQEPGKLGQILISPRGCHIVMLERAEPGQVVPYARAQKLILERMQRDRWEEKSDDYYRKLREVVHVEVLQPQFPAEYAWRNVQGKKIPRRIGMGTLPALETPQQGKASE